jgi:hypothetical protein
MDGVLLQCLGQEEAKRMMSEVHDIIGRQYWKIALNITRDVKIVRSLEIFKEFQHQL